MKKISFQIQIVGAIFILLALLLTFSMLVIIMFQKNTVRSVLEGSAMSSSQFVVSLIEGIMIEGNATTVPSALESINQDDTKLQVQIYRIDGKSAFSDYSTLEAVNNYQSDIEFSRRERHPQFFLDSEVFKSVVETSEAKVQFVGENLEVFFPITNTADCRICHGSDSELRGVLSYRVSGQLYLELLRNNYLLFFLLLLGGCIVILITLIVLLEVAVSFPLRNLAKNILDFSQGDFSVQPVKRTGSNILASLHRRTNTLFRSIEDRYTSEVHKRIREVNDKEKQKYLSIVSEAILHIGQDKRLTKDFSRAAVSLFRTDDIEHKTLSEFLYPLEPMGGNIRNEIDDFINILYEINVNEELFTSLNPLVNRKIQIANSEDDPIIQVSCSFHRFVEEDGSYSIMIIVRESSGIVDSLEEIETIVPNEKDHLSGIPRQDISANLIEFHKSLDSLTKQWNTKFNKHIRFTIRTKIQHLQFLGRIRKALIQLVYNALSHGIEDPAEREERGKNSEGLIELVISKQTGGYKIIVADDGRGINFITLEDQARKAGLIPPSTPTIDQNQLARLLFTEEYAQVSGNKEENNLSTVYLTVQSLGGTITIYTQEHKGTHFTIFIPEEAVQSEEEQ